MRAPACLAVAAALLAGCGSSAREAREQEAPTRPPRVETALPDWLAPGAPLRVAGWAGSEAEVVLLVGGRRVARTTAGPLGRFRLEARAPEPGRRAVAVEAAGVRVPVGVLQVRPLRLAAVGDVMLEGAVAAHGPAHPWTGAASLLAGADVATANLETAVSRRGAAVAGKEYTFRAAPEMLQGMAGIAGIDVVSVANNHALDYGREAFLDTLAHVRAAGMQPVGGGRTLREARRPALVEAGGVRVAFLAYSDVNPLGFPAGPATAGTARAVAGEIHADVRAALRRADVVVCWFHWGVELRADPTAEQHTLAAAALNAGAQLVLGAHPHVLGSTVRPRRGALVAWSLGNFVFPSFRPETVRTGVLVARLDAKGVRGHDLVPFRIEGFRPVPAR